MEEGGEHYQNTLYKIQNKNDLYVIIFSISSFPDPHSFVFRIHFLLFAHSVPVLKILSDKLNNIHKTEIYNENITYTWDSMSNEESEFQQIHSETSSFNHWVRKLIAALKKTTEYLGQINFGRILSN